MFGSDLVGNRSMGVSMVVRIFSGGQFFFFFLGIILVVTKLMFVVSFGGLVVAWVC